MKPSLQLKISQNLTMTPQLQQAIRLLQLSSIELQTEIQEALESNMMLETDDSVQEPAEDTPPDQKNDHDGERLPEELPVDADWQDIYDDSISFSPSASSYNTGSIEIQEAAGKTLAEHLLWQLNMYPVNETDRAVATAIIGVLDKDGYLTCSLDEVLFMLEGEPDIGLDKVEAMLHLIQAMEPAGVGARDLQECLRIQLLQYDPGCAQLKSAMELVNNHMGLLAAHDYNQLMRKLGLDQEQLSETIALIQSLHPRPGRLVHDEPVEYIVPDVYVRKANERWTVELNPDLIPGIRINNRYANMIRRADNSSENNSLKEHLQEARWFIKSLQSRNETLLKVATCIVSRQQAFLEHGEQAMKPMVLHDIADEIGMHESTISRATTRKYMHTPRGIFELKYFFSSHVNAADGIPKSSVAIRSLIKTLVSGEDPRKPLSDNKIARLLCKRGINVARRTVAKYREAMNIPPSSERRRLV